jgi:hypothetical protein
MAPCAHRWSAFQPVAGLLVSAGQVVRFAASRRKKTAYLLTTASRQPRDCWSGLVKSLESMKSQEPSASRGGARTENPETRLCPGTLDFPGSEFLNSKSFGINARG